MDEDGNIVRVKKKVGGKPVVDNRAKKQCYQEQNEGRRELRQRRRGYG